MSLFYALAFYIFHILAGLAYVAVNLPKGFLAGRREGLQMLPLAAKLIQMLL
jgi:hypothetical protein